MHACMHTHTHIHTHTRTHIHKHTYTHTQMHTHKHKHAHSTHPRGRPLPCASSTRDPPAGCAPPAPPHCSPTSTAGALQRRLHKRAGASCRSEWMVMNQSKDPVGACSCQPPLTDWGLTSGGPGTHACCSAAPPPPARSCQLVYTDSDTHARSDNLVLR